VKDKKEVATAAANFKAGGWTVNEGVGAVNRKN
jgi:hypothetical protein